MPQSLLKTPGGAGQALEVNGRSLTASHEQIASILRSRLGQNHAELLAAPKPDADGGIAWSTALAGAVQPAAQLPEDERARLRQRAERFGAEIRGLAQQLRGEGPAAQLVAQMLEQALRTPPGDAWLYSVGGRPVLVMWGHAAPGAVPPVSAAPGVVPPVSAAPGPVAALTGGEAPPVPPPPAGSPPPAGGGWKRWLPWALLALLLALLLWGLKRCSDEQAAAAAGLDEQIAQAELRNRALEEEIARRRAQQPVMQCVPDAPPPEPPPAASAPEPEPAPEPAPAASMPEPEAPASAPPPDPRDELKRRIAAAGKDCNALQGMLKNEPLLKGGGDQASALKQQIGRAMEKNCREKLIQEAKNLCPGERPKELAPEMVIVFDASGSMNFSLAVTEAQIRQSGEAAAVEGLMRQFGLGGLARGGALERLTREPKRITVAKRAAVAVVQRVPSDMSVGLVLVEQCPSARPIGFFPPARRGALIGQIQGIQPRAGTPLADGIEEAGRMLDGVRRESLMVVVSDGVESCGRDPCAVAAALARAKPHLKINVVDITGTGAGNCVARATGGRVFTANNPDEVVAMMNRAAQDAMGPANCKR